MRKRDESEADFAQVCPSKIQGIHWFSFCFVFRLLRKVIEVLIYVDDESYSGEYRETRAVSHTRNYRIVRRNFGDVHEPVIFCHDFRILGYEEVVRRREDHFEERHPHDREIRPLLPSVDAVRNASVQDSECRIDGRGRNPRQRVRTELCPDDAPRHPHPVHESHASERQERKSENHFEPERHRVVVIRIVVDVFSLCREKVGEGEKLYEGNEEQ